MYDCEASMNDTSIIMLSHSKHLLLESYKKYAPSYMSQEALIVIVKNWKHPKCTSIGA